MNAANALIANSENALRIGDQHQSDPSVGSSAKHLLQSSSLTRIQKDPILGGSVVLAEALDHSSNRWCVDHRQHGFEVRAQEGVEQHQIAPPQSIHKAELLQRLVDRLKRLPAALHLLVQTFTLGREQPFQGKDPAFFRAEGRAFVEGWLA